MKKLLGFFIVIMCLVQTSFAQFTKRSTATLSNSQPAPIQTIPYLNKPTNLIDQPTAGILRSGDLETRMRFYEEGALMTRLSVGISNRLNFGVSFSGEHFTGGGDIKWQKIPGVHFIYRAVEEKLNMPAIVIGLDTQGYGKYWDENTPPNVCEFSDTPGLIVPLPKDRFSFKSKGFYLVVSKGFQSLTMVGMHAGFSYSLDQSKVDNDIDLFMGMNVEIIPNVSAIFEYDFATNDDEIKYTNNGRGYLNIGFRWAFAKDMTIEYDFKNLLSDNSNKCQYMGWKRILRFSYSGRIIP